MKRQHTIDRAQSYRLPLPSIKQQRTRIPRTTHSHRPKNILSPTYSSPQDQQLLYQVSLLFRKPKALHKINKRHDRIHSVNNDENISNDNRNHNSLPLIDSIKQKKLTEQKLPPRPIKPKQQNKTQQIDAILKEKSKFVENYFLELHSKRRRTSLNE